MLMRLFHLLRLEVSQNRLARWINSNSVYELIRPRAWEPEVLECLCNGKVHESTIELGSNMHCRKRLLENGGP